ncbi:MAG TPA: multidrug ABC transporter ATP-binding protein, partial [Clostridiales bacterium]|nr:multidrug ABC transporter ATP-binding protein [Clostridiales bacterium]
MKKSLLGRLFALFFADKRRSAAMMALLIISGVFVSLGPRVLGFATDTLASGLVAGGIDWGAFLRWAGIALAVYGVQFVTKWAAGWISTRIVSDIAYDLRARVEKKLWKLPLNYYDTGSRGDIMSRTTNDIDNVVNTLNQTGGDFFYYVLMLVGMIIMMFSLSWQLALVTLVLIPLSAIIVRFVSKASGPQFKKQWDYTGKINSNVEESFNGHTIIKAYGREEQFTETFREQNEALYKASFKATSISNLIQPLSRFITNINYVIVALVGALRIINGQMTIGDVQAFIQYARQFQQPFTQLAQMFSVLQSGMASLGRVFELLDSEEEEADDPSLPARHDLSGQIDFQDVFFSYTPEKKLIEHMNLSVKPGETVAIVGSTGAGKTTLVNLIERFYEIDSGRIVLDGKWELHELSRAALRRNIGMVLQDTWLHKGTIEENIKYGLPDDVPISDEEFRAACEATFVDGFVRTLPDGYNTMLNNELASVSAGEKQLLTIARAFLVKPNILILDEATSSVDTRTEALIQEAINKLREGRTSFVIAHRL